MSKICQKMPKPQKYRLGGLGCNMIKGQKELLCSEALENLETVQQKLVFYKLGTDGHSSSTSPLHTEAGAEGSRPHPETHCR